MSQKKNPGRTGAPHGAGKRAPAVSGVAGDILKWLEERSHKSTAEYAAGGV